MTIAGQSRGHTVRLLFGFICLMIRAAAEQTQINQIRVVFISSVRGRPEYTGH